MEFECGPSPDEKMAVAAEEAKRGLSRRAPELSDARAL
jgi:hypothetical protein